MHSQILRRSRSLLKASAHSRYYFIHTEQSSRLPRKKQTSGPIRTNKRFLSSAKDVPDGETTAVALASGSAQDPPDPPAEVPEKIDLDTVDLEKPKRGKKVALKEDFLQLPADLQILWSPEESTSDGKTSPSLPPQEIFEEALNNLHIAMHPQTQHKACFPSSTSPALEPTLALYCPIEGGEYVIDKTVRELARRTDSDVVVIDAVHLAAGEWGHFGKAASSLQLPRNPLHFPQPAQSPRSTSRPVMMEEEEDDDDESGMSFPQQMTLHLITPPARGRSILSPSIRTTSAPSKVKLLFDELINIPGISESAEKPTSRRPRIIYIRDFSTLSPSAAAWYPHLLAAARQRRVGALPRSNSPISNPTTLVFGITPSITPPASAFGPGGNGQGLINMLMSRSPPGPMGAFNSKPAKSEWGESEVAEKEREKRLRERLRKWERGDAALQDELPLLPSVNVEESGNKPKSGVVVIGGSGGISGFPPFLENALAGKSSDPRDGSDSDGTRFFRTSVLVPNLRSLTQERFCRIGRRREINEITMRMGIGAIGGVLEQPDHLESGAELRQDKTDESAVHTTPVETDEEKMWTEWGKKVEVWTAVKQIADRAVGRVVSEMSGRCKLKSEKSTLEPTFIPWSAVHQAWSSQRSSRDLRKVWLKGSSVKQTREHSEGDVESDDAKSSQTGLDEVVERIKQDPELEQHEQRLLSCIVDAAAMPTSFSQVHLPPHTIDSVRTIVSLPLLHPVAFQRGILKQHGMTGCLLFGPPGTGKTLVVRALAKEAGCRMMAISPSDVMDMYVGEGEKLVKAVFTLARKLSPCVVFLDEIDALFGARMSSRESGGAFHRGVITEFMQEMDGLRSSKDDRVIVIGATNRPFDLDDAVLRRLPRRLLVDLPGENEREEILKILLRDEALDTDLDLKMLAKKTESFSGSDLKHLCVSAALDAVKELVVVPWTLTSPTRSELSTSSDITTSESSVSHKSLAASATSPSPAHTATDPKVDAHNHTLALRHFNKALKEITPSSSESLGSLAELRKWNVEFGEGRKDRKRQQVWGKDRFGFTNKTDIIREEGRVAAIGGSGPEAHAPLVEN